MTVFETRWPCRKCGRRDTVNTTERADFLVCLACGEQEPWADAVKRLGRPTETNEPGPYLRRVLASGRAPLGVDYEIDDGEKEP